MHRRQLLKQTALTIAGFTLGRDLFAHEMDQRILLSGHTDIIKLSSNENPHGPSPLARKAMIDAVNGSNRYPWDNTTILREKIAKEFGLTSKHVIIGAGSSELLGLVASLAALTRGNAVTPDPTFRLWIPAAKNSGLSIKLVPLTPGKITDLNRMKESIDTATSLVYICNPNNPTGTVLPANELEAFLRLIPSNAWILLDEAYTEFSDEPSLARFVDSMPNLVVAKTFSKAYGMAGARVGYALAHPDTIAKLNGMQPWANAGASAVSLAGAIAAIDDKPFISFCKEENRKAKEIFTRGLDAKGIRYIPSHTSFVYFDSTNYKGDVKAALEAKKIYGARSFEDNSPWLRLSVGTQDEMKQVVAALG